jgi:outer membrane protein assembly factor BamB
MTAYDHGGERIWQRDLLEDFGAFNWGFAYGASPLLYDGRLYVQLMRSPTRRRGPQGEPVDALLLALDPATGDDLWQCVRGTSAVGESHEAYVTPAPRDGPTGRQIVLAGGDAVTGHDAATGAEVWRCEYNERRRTNWRVIPTPASDEERVFVSMPRGSSFVAFTPGGPADALADRTVWTMQSNAPDVCSPLLYGGRLYVLDGDRHVLTCLNPETGDQIWRGTLDATDVIRSSPTAADGKIYLIDESGRAFVLAAGDEFRVISQIEMGGGGPTRSSIVISGNRLYVRTAAALHCIGAAAGPA